MYSLKFNKKLLKKIHLPIKSLEFNVSDQLIETLGIKSSIDYVTIFINKRISREDRYFLRKLKFLKTTLLLAHGEKHKRFGWHFVDNKRAKSVSKWVKQKEKFDLIILIVCNPGEGEIKTEKSLLIISEGEITFYRSIMPGKKKKMKVKARVKLIQPKLNKFVNNS